MSNQPIIVVKKVKGHGGHHGGAWKVAYADFVTAMMAFFLVMWLVGQSKQVKSAIGGYFRDPGVFETGRGGSGVLDGGAQTAEATAATTTQAERTALEQSVAHMRERLDSVPEFKTLRDQIDFTVTSEGMRVDLIEASGSNFFESGSASMPKETEHILGMIAKEIGTLDNAVIIEGHTDSRPYASKDGYSNWELSADRANAARRVMERLGLQPAQVQSVRGHADRQPRNNGDPADPRNRRVSILVRSKAS